MAERQEAEQTAYGPIVVVAVEQSFPQAQRLITDALAEAMLPWGYRLLVWMCRWPWMRGSLFEASEKKAPGIWAGVCGRKRYVEETVVAAVGAGAKAVVILGAGLDSLGARLSARGVEVPLFELDLPSNSALKGERIRAHFGEIPPGMRLIQVDFEQADLGAALEGQGFEPLEPAVFVWEGVTQYLTEEGVRRAMAFLSQAARGSSLVFTYVRGDFISGEALYGSEVLYEDLVQRRGVWHFGLTPEAVGPLLAEYGWEEEAQLGAAEIAARYVAPSGRALPVSEIERCVRARKG